MSQHTQHASSLAGVAYEAAAPLNAEVRTALARTTLAEFLAARPTTGAPVVTLDVDDSVGHAMETLARYRISAAPVLESTESGAGVRQAPYYGFLDVPTVMAAFLEGNYMKPMAHADRPGAHAEDSPPPRHTTTAETLAAVPTPLREDIPEKPRMLSRLEMLNTVGPDFARTPLRHVAPGRDGELLFRAAATHSLLEIVRDGFLSPPAAGLAACHRLAVFDFAQASGAEPSGPGIRVTHIVSQTDVVRWLAKHVSDGTAGRLPSATLQDLGLTPKHVVCVSADEPAIDAYAKLLKSNLAAAAVCTSAGVVVASLHLALLNGINADKLGVLALPVGEFLALRHGTVWGSAPGRPPSPGAGGAAGLSRRDTLMQQHALVSVTADATLGAVIDLLATRHARAVFVVDDAHKPLSVVTPTDVLRVATEEHGPTAGDVALPPPQQQ